MHRLLLPLLCSIAGSGLLAQRALLDQLPPEREACTFRHIGFGDEFTPLELPGEGVVRGLVRMGSRLWVARGDDLFGLGWPGLERQVAVAAPESLVALSADERFLYALRSDAVMVLDPHAGRVVRTEPLPAAAGARALAMVHHDGRLCVCTDKQLVAIDLQTGRPGEAAPWSHGEPQWLASDGTRIWAGMADRCLQLASGPRLPLAGATTWPWPLRNSAATWIDGRLLLAADYLDERSREQFVCGLLTVRPGSEEVMSLKLYAGAGGGVTFELGPKPLRSRDELAAELRRIAADPAVMVLGKDGQRQRMTVVLEAWPGVLVRDLTAAWDVVVAAGFEDVRSPAQESWVREQARAKAAATKAK